MSALDQLRKLQKLKDDGVVSEPEYDTRRDAIIDRLTAEPTLKGRVFRFGVFGCFSLAAAAGFLIFGLSAIGFLLLRHSSSSNLNRQLSDVHEPLIVGSSGSIKTFRDVENRVTIMRVADPGDGLSTLGAASEGNHYVTVDVAVESVRTLPGNLPALRGGDFMNSFFAQTTSGPGQALRLMTATLTFEIPNGSTVNSLRFNPNVLFGSIYFDR